MPTQMMFVSNVMTAPAACIPAVLKVFRRECVDQKRPLCGDERIKHFIAVLGVSGCSFCRLIHGADVLQIREPSRHHFLIIFDENRVSI